ncbi:MAG: exodeoxyribonuclease VII small subunit [Ruminiclostridium sp.]|nr:exodeoxyribonuclease VII small subunit [Ruminiclostridium sp.]
MKFDEAYKRLSEISKEMDNRDLPLERAVELYSEAARLTEECRKDIEDAKLKIEKIDGGRV